MVCVFPLKHAFFYFSPSPFLSYSFAHCGKICQKHIFPHCAKIAISSLSPRVFISPHLPFYLILLHIVGKYAKNIFFPHCAKIAISSLFPVVFILISLNLYIINNYTVLIFVLFLLDIFFLMPHLFCIRKNDTNTKITIDFYTVVYYY